MLHSKLIVRRMAQRRLTAAMLAEACRVPEDGLHRALRGEDELRPSNLMRLCLALRLPLHRVLNEPAPVKPFNVVYVGLSGLPSAAVREQAEGSYELLTLSKWLPNTAEAVLQVRDVRYITPTELALQCRERLGLQAHKGLSASQLLELLSLAGVAVTPSMRGQSRREHWTTVSRLRTSGQVVVHWPVVAEPLVRLHGLACALGAALTMHQLSAAQARRFGEHLAQRLLGPDSTDDVTPRVDRTDPERFVATSRACRLGLVMDAVQGFQDHWEGGRNHAFVSGALRCVLADAYALSGELCSGFKRNQANTLPQEPPSA